GIIIEALHKLGFDEGLYDLIKEPLRMFQVRIPVRMDVGTVKTFTGYRAQHNVAVGPTLGGVRFLPDVDEEEVIALSMWMCL
ncbi:Glu/Leu/Phe/Val dehydrogenase dimerization domain-containing protein, partial [Staphylococcus aureus]|nr:Glu/Leu/Phe/Val dehydrogenase dimerization domain-containing protein [Staphylococcus aureus]